MFPLVSILIPAYNAQQWITETIQSALDQSWPRKEIIIVDDGSTDNTLSIIRKYESPFLKVIHQENRGGCQARNRAFQQCQGDYIQWLDADDLLAPGKIELQLSALRHAPDHRVLCTAPWGRFYFRPSKAQFHATPLWNDHEPVEWLVLRLSNPGMMPPHSWLVSRPLTELAGPWDERLVRNQDGEYFTRVVSFSHLVKFAPNAFCFYRKSNPVSVSKTVSRKAWLSIFLSNILEAQHVLAREDSERTRTACAKRLYMVALSLDLYAPDLADRLRSKVFELDGSILSRKESSWKTLLMKRLLGEKFTRTFSESLSRARGQALCQMDLWLAKLFREDIK